MKFVVASQRIDLLANRGETRDGLDQAWTTLCNAIGIGLVPIPNRLEALDALLQRLQPAAVLLTGGNAVACGPDAEPAYLDRDEIERRLLEWATSRHRPMLAVCRGFQFLNVHFGGRLRALEGHVRTRHPLAWDPAILAEPHALTEVNSYHAVGIGPDDLAPCLRPLARSGDGSVEAAMHRTLPILGVMWHPEREPMAQGPFLDFLRGHLLAIR